MNFGSKSKKHPNSELQLPKNMRKNRSPFVVVWWWVRRRQRSATGSGIVAASRRHHRRHPPQPAAHRAAPSGKMYALLVLQLGATVATMTTVAFATGGPAWLRPRIHYAPAIGHPGDISAALSHGGLHHVWQLTSGGTGTNSTPSPGGWHHRVSRDLVHWRAANASRPVGPANWPSGFAIPAGSGNGNGNASSHAGYICAGLRCDACAPPPGGKPLCPLGKDNTSACQQPPLALRCATNAAATEWSEVYEPLFPVEYYRGLPYDPFRPFMDTDGMWLVAMLPLVVAAPGCAAPAVLPACLCVCAWQAKWSRPGLRSRARRCWWRLPYRQRLPPTPAG